MATIRPVVSVYQFDSADQKKGTIRMPAVLSSPLRPDLVLSVHTGVSKNKRQPYAVAAKAGYGTAAESWGTGRAVARIPRVPGGGTHRAGQAAFGNMCRGGGMFSPTKTWRRWHRRVNVTQKRHAVATALAASAIPPLVMARGHRIGDIAELPLVITDGVESIKKTKDAIDMLKKLGCAEELKKVADSRQIRCGQGKMRSRRYVMRRGPLVVYAQDEGIVRAARNIPGVETTCVDRLNLLQLAPGGTFGRFLIWTESAFKKLHDIYGTLKSGAPLKKKYTLPRVRMENADVARIINSNEVQSVLKAKLEAPKKFAIKKNPLRNPMVMARLYPGINEIKAERKRVHDKTSAERKSVDACKKQRIADSKAYIKKAKKGDETFYKKVMGAFEAAAAKKDDESEEVADDASE